MFDNSRNNRNEEMFSRTGQRPVFPNQPSQNPANTYVPRNRPQQQPSQINNQPRRNNFVDQRQHKLLNLLENLPKYAVALASWIWAIFKSVLIVTGIVSINLADSAMGALALSLMFNNVVIQYTGISDIVLGTVFSLGLSAVQIYMWMLIDKRGIGLTHLFHWSRVPKDVKTFLGVALFLWFIDTFIDTVPLEVILTNENFPNDVYFLLIKFSVYVITIVLCGGAELITGNMKKMLDT